ncbi:hypothetical protein [Embleya sp. NPDC001921]
MTPSSTGSRTGIPKVTAICARCRANCLSSGRERSTTIADIDITRL